MQQDSDVFREKYCYTEEVTAVIEANEKSLKVLYNMYASADGLNASAGPSQTRASKRRVWRDRYGCRYGRLRI